MELWVRSQDKTQLLNATGFYYDYQQEKHYITCLTKDNDLYWVGIYKSKERALEVLNEIQNILKNNQYGYKVNGLGEKVDIIPNQIFVYEMPKE